jgi:hypothetical protein
VTCILVNPQKKYKVCDNPTAPVTQAAPVLAAGGSNLIVGASVGAAVCGVAVSGIAYMRLVAAQRAHLTANDADQPVWADMVRLSDGSSSGSRTTAMDDARGPTRRRSSAIHDDHRVMI